MKRISPKNRELLLIASSLLGIGAVILLGEFFTLYQLAEYGWK